MQARERSTGTAWLRAVALASAAVVSGCGGGAGDSGGGVTVVPGPPTASPPPTPTPSPTPVAPPPTAELSEYQRSSAAIAANADAAYRAGATGRGIRIAVLDTGVTSSLSEFSGRIDPASADVAGNRGLVDLNGHGTWMSSVALAARDGRGIHGVAFEATLLSFNMSTPGDCTPQSCATRLDHIVQAIDAAVAAGARVINFSAGLDEVYPEIIGAVRRAAAAGVIMVVSGGNKAGASEPDVLARAMAEAGAGLVIIAGGHDGAGRAHALTNRAGDGPASAWYLGALSVDVAVTGRDGTVFALSGSSVSTAAISGAVAVVAQARPNLTGAQIVSLLLNNATDPGAPGRDAVYGNGNLNLATTFAALNAGS